MRIFIASSSELNQERKDLQLLLYRNKIEPIVWENIDHSIGTDRFQTRINEEHLLTSDFVIFMIKSKLGQFTLEEFEEAYKSLGSKIEGILIYFFEFDKNIVHGDELFKILSLENFLKKEGKYPQKVKDFKDLENHFLEQMIHHLKPTINNESTKTLKTEELEQQTRINQIKKICIYTAEPLNTSIKFNLGVIKNQFNKFDIELHHKILNEDSLLEHYEFDLCFIFTKTNSDKIIIEDEYFIQKSIALEDLLELIDENKVILVLDNNIENNKLKIKIAENDSQIKKLLSSTIHKELKLEKGNYTFHKLSTELPDLIDTKNLNQFVGRNTDIENLVKKISNLKNENKILTIKGSGGIGKTTLVSKVVDEFAYRGEFKDGIKFVQCEFIKDYEDFEHKISMAFDMTNALNFETQLKEQINQEDSDRLIILDNVETILHLENTDKIKEFVKYISNFATIVITSREKLNEDFEFVYELRELTTDEAEELFLKCYEMKEKGYYNKFLRTEILENMLNNNPLAIKLVTSNLPKNKNLQTLKNELENNFFDLTSKDIENIFDKESDLNIQRTKSLFNSINYSYSRLSEKEKLALELLSLFPDGIHFENFKIFYNGKADNHKISGDLIKRKKDNFSDKDLKSLEDKSLIINTNERINLQSIIGRFADYKFQNKDNEEKKEYYKKAYGYNAFVLELIENPKTKNSVSSHIFDDNKNNFLKSLDYIKYLEINEAKISFIDDLCDYFGMSSSPNENILQKLKTLKDSIDDKIKKDYLNSQILNIKYFYGDFSNVYNQIKEQYLLSDIVSKKDSSDNIQKLMNRNILLIYGMEGYQYDEAKLYTKENKFDYSFFQIGEYNITLKFVNNVVSLKISFMLYEILLNTDKLDIEVLKKYIKSLYKTQFIDKMQITYTLLKADKSEVSLKDINKLIVTNPFTYGLKTLMLAIKSEKETSKEMYEKAIEKLYHIKYYYVEAILLYSEHLKNIKDDDFEIWLKKGQELSSKHYYRYLLHRFNCLEKNIRSEYNEDDYPLPEKLDYTEIIKKYGL